VRTELNHEQTTSNCGTEKTSTIKWGEEGVETSTDIALEVKRVELMLNQLGSVEHRP